MIDLRKEKDLDPSLGKRADKPSDDDPVSKSDKAFEELIGKGSLKGNQRVT